MIAFDQLEALWRYERRTYKGTALLDNVFFKHLYGSFRSPFLLSVLILVHVCKLLDGHLTHTVTGAMELKR